MFQDDGRAAEARAIPVLEAASRLDIRGLRKAGQERIGPCPVCGGQDRFSINPNRRVWNCRVCNEGGGSVDLVIFVNGCDFKAALDFLVGKGGGAVDPQELERRRIAREKEEEKRRDAEAALRAKAIRDGREIWGASQPAAGTVAESYLLARVMHLPGGMPPTIRFLPDHKMIKKIGGRFVELHRGPCMIAAIQGPEGRVQAVHQTWIDPARPGRKAEIKMPDGTAAPSKLVRGSKRGGAIRLTALGASGVMVMGEGIETTLTALSANARPSAAHWAGIDLGNMAGRQTGRSTGVPDLGDTRAFVPPQGVSRLFYLMDGDSNPKMTRAKLLAGLRRAKAHNPDLQGWIVPADQGRDLNDMLQDEARADRAKHDERPPDE